MDGKTTIAQLKEVTHKFRDARGWHGTQADDIAKSIVIESAELLEHFQWDSTDLHKSHKKNKDIEEISSEVADVFNYLCEFCILMKIDLTEALYKKLEHLEKKYPVEQFRDGHNEHFYQSQKKAYRK